MNVVLIVTVLIAVTVLSGLGRVAWESAHYLAWGACTTGAGVVVGGLVYWLRGRGR